MEPLTLGGRKTRRGKMYRGVVSKLWGNGVAAVVAMSIVDDVVELACQGLFVERVVRGRGVWSCRECEAGRGGRGCESSRRKGREKMRVRVVWGSVEKCCCVVCLNGVWGGRGVGRGKVVGLCV